MTKTILITGASDGIGAAAARRLTRDGHRVIIVGRSAAKTKKIAEELKVPYHIADFSNLDEVKTLAATIRAQYPHIDVFINNAGAIIPRKVITEDGFELTLQANYLAPFLLTHLLLDVLQSSKALVINTSSSAHQIARSLRKSDFDTDLNYSKWVVYGKSKLGNLLHARELDRRYKQKGIRAVSFHPGVVSTSFFRNDGGLLSRIVHSAGAKVIGIVTPEQGADTMVWLAETTSNRDLEGGGYYKKRKLARDSKVARSEARAKDLWDTSIEVLGV